MSGPRPVKQPGLGHPTPLRTRTLTLSLYYEVYNNDECSVKTFDFTCVFVFHVSQQAIEKILDENG